MSDTAVVIGELDHSPVYCWSQESFTLKEFTQMHEARLPQVIKVTAGYLGQNIMHSVSIDEVLFVHGIRCQRRIVAKDNLSRRYSIPMEMCEDMRVKKNGQECSKSVKSLVSRGGDKWRSGGGGHDRYTVYFTRDINVNFCHLHDVTRVVQFGEMELVDCYEEKYLISNSILSKGSMSKQVTLLPVYVQIQVKHALGIQHGHEKDWKTCLLRYNSVLDKIDVKNARGNQEIIVLPSETSPASGTTSGSGDDYEYLEPRYFIKRTVMAGAQASTADTVAETHRDQAVYEEIEPRNKTATSDKRAQLGSVGVQVLPVGLPIGRTRRRPSTEQGQPAERIGQTSGGDIQVRSLPVPPPYKRGPTATGRDVASSDSAGNLTTPEEAQPSSTYKPLAAQKRSKPRVSPKPDDVTRRTTARNSSVSSIPSSPTEPFVPASGTAHGDQNAYESIDVSQHLSDMDHTYETLTTFPANRSVMSVSQIGRALRALHLEQYVPSFRENHVDGAILMELTQDILQESFGFNKFEALKLVKFANGWTPRC